MNDLQSEPLEPSGQISKSACPNSYYRTGGGDGGFVNSDEFGGGSSGFVPCWGKTQEEWDGTIALSIKLLNDVGTEFGDAFDAGVEVTSGQSLPYIPINAIVPIRYVGAAVTVSLQGDNQLIGTIIDLPIGTTITGLTSIADIAATQNNALGKWKWWRIADPGTASTLATLSPMGACPVCIDHQGRALVGNTPTTGTSDETYPGGGTGGTRDYTVTASGSFQTVDVGTFYSVSDYLHTHIVTITPPYTPTVRVIKVA